MTASQLSIQSFGREKKVGFCAAPKGYSFRCLGLFHPNRQKKCLISDKQFPCFVSNGWMRNILDLLPRRLFSGNPSGMKLPDKENRSSSDRHLMFPWLDYTSFLDGALVFFHCVSDSTSVLSRRESCRAGQELRPRERKIHV